MSDPLVHSYNWYFLTKNNKIQVKNDIKLTKNQPQNINFWNKQLQLNLRRNDIYYFTHMKKWIIFIKLIALEEILTYFISNCFISPDTLPFSISASISLIILIALHFIGKESSKREKIKATPTLFIVALAFIIVWLRTSIVWASLTFPVTDANAVLLTLSLPFDDFAYSMLKLYFKTTIPNALIITAILVTLSLLFFRTAKKQIFPTLLYFTSTIVLFVQEIPVTDYLNILTGQAEKNASYSQFFEDNYIHPDSVQITAPEQKRNLIVIFLESLETSFADTANGGFLNENLIPEITALSQQHINFGRNGKHIGGGTDAMGSTHTFGATVSKTLGVPMVRVYSETPAYLHYKGLYEILDESNYHQIFFQGNHGLFPQFKKYFLDRSVKEIYGPDDLIKILNIDEEAMTKNHGAKTVPDKDAFVFAEQILDTISEPFSLTFFTIDTHSPYGIYDADCIKAVDEDNKDEVLKATARCVSRELGKFIDYTKQKSFYQNTTIVVFGDHYFMGERLVKHNPNKKWVNFFINATKTPIEEEHRVYTDVDMFPTMLSAMGYKIEGDRLALGTDLFSNKKTILEKIGLDSLNKEHDKLVGHLTYESYKYAKK